MSGAPVGKSKRASQGCSMRQPVVFQASGSAVRQCSTGAAPAMQRHHAIPPSSRIPAPSQQHHAPLVVFDIDVVHVGHLATEVLQHTPVRPDFETLRMEGLDWIGLDWHQRLHWETAHVLCCVPCPRAQTPGRPHRWHACVCTPPRSVPNHAQPQTSGASAQSVGWLRTEILIFMPVRAPGALELGGLTGRPVFGLIFGRDSRPFSACTVRPSRVEPGGWVLS